ncbi:MAG TPA: S8 family serine peptidase [Chitinophagaceae bacterium]
MRIKLTYKILALTLGFSLAQEKLKAQDNLFQYVLLSSDKAPNGTGITLIGSSITINGVASTGYKGTVGAYKMVQTTGNTTIKAHILSGDKVSITNSNIIEGNIKAGNSSGSTGTVVSIGSSVTLTGNIDSKGNIVVGGGSVNGTVNVLGTYSGPTPSNPVIGNNPQVPALPTMPAPKTFSSPPTTNITGNTTLTSNSADTIFSGNIIFSGNKTLKLVNPGVYVFNSFQWSGNSNKLIFDFNGSTTGIFYIYVKNNADFGKLNSSVANASATSASRIYIEVQGDGTTGTSISGYSCIIANGSSGGGSKCQGTIYATNGGISCGAGTGSSSFTGALYSTKAINIQSGVNFVYEPFDPCGGLAANAGPDRPLDFVGHAVLTGSSNIPGVSFSWQAVPDSGGVIFSQNTNQPQITVASQGLYRLTVQNATNGCVATDDVKISGRLKSIIGSELQSIFDYKITDNTYFDIVDGYVKIDIIANAGRRAIVIQKLLESLNPGKPGLKDTVPNGLSPLTITGRFFVDSLPKLNLMGVDINFCRPYYKPILFTNGEVIVEDTSRVGLLRSAGDATINTNLVRIGYSLYGDGVKIGVLSDSYSSISSGTTATLPLQPSPPAPPNFLPQTFNTNTAAADITNRDIPANIHILPVVPAISGTDEGRAMLQIVHDVAPGAELYFRSGFHTAGDLANGIKLLADAGCKIIVDDITYSTEPFLKDGVVAKAVDQVKAAGVTYFSSAGNFGNKSYEANFNPHNFNGKVVHNFAPSGSPDPFEKIKLAPGDYTFVFQWVDNIYSLNETAGTQVDLDIYLTKTEDGSGLIGFNRDNLIGDPIEFIPITVPPGDSVEYNIYIVNNTPANNINPRMMYIAFRGNPRFMESYHTGGSTVVGQANANGAIAVGASRFNHQPGHPLLPDALSGITKPQIESFSSRGGTLMMGELTPRQKPEMVGPDGVNTTVKLGQDYPNNALDGWSNFFGTSAAAPHAAAAAALIIQGRQRFLNQATTPDQVKSLFQSTATDMETPGFDFISGVGLINADAAMRTFAEPRPHNIRLVLPTGSIGSAVDSFQVIVVGENFSSNTEIWYNDVQLEPDSINATFDTIWVTVPIPDPNGGRTEIRAYNPPNPNTVVVNGEHLDGGFSNSLFFGEAEIVVTALDAAIKYGQQIPTVFDTLITINGKRLQDTTLTLAQLGLQNMLVTTNAPENPNVGTYTITPSFNPLNLPDEEFFFKYNYRFVNGNLSIAKMPLTVTPDPITVIAGQALGNVTFNYAFDHTNVPNAQGIIDDLRAAHQAFLPNNALAVVKDFATSGLTTSALGNMNTMASFRAIRNSRKFQIDATGALVPLTDPNTFPVQYLVDVAAQSIVDYRQNPALASFYAAYPGINKKALLGGTALNNKTAKVNVNNTLEPIVNGTLAQTLLTNTGPKAPIFNNELVQIVNGELVHFVNGALEPIVNQELVQIVNNELVQLVNGTILVIGNNELVQLVNNTLVMMVNGQLEQVVNGIKVQDVNGALEPLVNQGLVLLVNNELVQIVNGELQPVTLANNEKVLLLNNELVQIVNNELVQIVNGELVQVVNNTLEPMVNQELVQIVNNELVQIVNGTITPVTLTNNQLVLFPNNELVQIVNNELVQIVNAQIENGQVNGTLEPFVNDANLSLVQIVNNELVQIVNGELVQVVNNTLEPIVNQELVQIVNNELVQFVNGVKTPVANNQLVLFPNNELVQIVNNELVQIVNHVIENGQVNGTLEPFVNYVNLNLINSELVQIVNNELVQIVNGVPKPIPNNSLVLFPNNELVQIVNNGLEPIVNNGLEPIVNSGLEPVVNNELVQFVNSNTTGVGNTNNNTAVIIDEEDINAEQHNWLGPMFGINMITGLDVGTNYLVPGKLVNPNFDITYALGIVNVIPDPCILTRGPFKNFGNTPAPQEPTSLWLNIATKVSGQLSVNGDFLLFKSGSVTFNNIASNPQIINFPLPDGKIIADNSVTAPVTSFDANTNTWITKVPVGFASTSDIFVSGAIINSSNGFVKQNGNTNSVVKGAFYCTKNFSDQWTYGIAAYRQPPDYDYVTYDQIGGAEQIQSINGTYRAGTPIPIIQYLVQGGSGGGGNSYTGSTSSFENFTACPIDGPSTSSPVTSAMMLEETQASVSAKQFQLMPNPASDNITLSFVPSVTGDSRLTVFSMDGKKVLEINSGFIEAGTQYTRKIDVSRFKNGVYLIQLLSADKATVRKFIIAR